MLRRVLAFGLLMCSKVALAQISLNVQVPPSGIVQKNQLWNLSLVHTGNSPTNVYLEVTLLSANVPVMRGIAKPILLGQGLRQIRDADVTPVNYSYLSSAFALGQNSSNDLLPAGVYDACYSVSYYQGETKVLLAEDCITLEVEALSPPLLNAPANGDTIMTRYPLFSWLPPVPFNLQNNINYNLTLVEVADGSSPTEAIQQSLPVYAKGGIRNLYQHYPASYKALDTGKLYAWRIVANAGTYFLAQSEVWTFRIHFDKPLYAILDNSYIKLQRGSEASYIQCKRFIKFEYDNVIGDSSVQCKIMAISDPSDYIQQTLVLKNGQNFITLLGNSLTDKRDYILEIINSRKERWILKFTYMNVPVTE